MTGRALPLSSISDLLLTGVILHDVGKVAELTYDRSFGYSSEGQLVGHIVIGLRLLHEKLQRFPDFPPKLRILVEHMILSHHGELEFGSPKVPLFPEALLLHHLDNLDSKMECMRALVAKDRHVEGCWTSYNSVARSLGAEEGEISGGGAGESAPRAETAPPGPRRRSRPPVKLAPPHRPLPAANRSQPPSAAAAPVRSSPKN